MIRKTSVPAVLSASILFVVMAPSSLGIAQPTTEPSPNPVSSTMTVPDTGIRAGFNTDAELASHGLDVDGWFHADPSEQEVAPDHVLILLEDMDYAEEVMNRGQITALESLEDDHILFRGTLALAEEDAQQLGVSEINVAFKPAASGTYGWEYKRELIFYALGRHLQTRGLVPIIERDVDWAPIAESTLIELTVEQQEKLTIFDDEEGTQWLHGSVQLWVQGYSNRLGHDRTSSNRLALFAGALRTGGTTPITGDPAWQSLSDMFVLDFLVGNSDRLYEGGSVMLPDGGQRLILLDNGDALLQYNPTPGETPPCQVLFESVRMFSPNVVEALDVLNEDSLRDLWRGTDGEPLVEDRHVRRVLERVEQALEHMDSFGVEGLFERNTPPML